MEKIILINNNNGRRRIRTVEQVMKRYKMDINNIYEWIEKGYLLYDCWADWLLEE